MSKLKNNDTLKNKRLISKKRMIHKLLTIAAPPFWHYADIIQKTTKPQPHQHPNNMNYEKGRYSNDFQQILPSKVP